MKTERSHQLFELASRYFPGGVNSPVRAWLSVGGEPLFIARAQGSHVIDADGNSYIDYVGSWGPLILGHAHSDVVAAIQETAARGTSYGAPSELEIELAKRIQSAFPSMELMRFVSSGTEATMSAIRLARAFTGRDKVLKFDGGYHGHADFLLSKAGSGVATFALPDSAGVPDAIAGTTIIAPYNDLDAVRRIMEGRAGEIAAVIVEPVAGNMGVVPPRSGFLEGLRKIAHDHLALIIFDEVITGFRVAWGGAQALYNVEPDLTCLGKIVGGGLPVGAYGGRRDIMELVAPLGPVYQAGTLSGNPLAMAAGIATLDAITSTPNPYEQLDMKAGELVRGLLQAAHGASIPMTVNRVGSMMTAFFNPRVVTDYKSAKESDTALYARFFRGMLETGVYLAPSQFEAMFVSLAHSETDRSKTIESAARALRAIQL
jgi:glutamate-1-semialdehyde 2,1-aminomutase